MDEQMLIEGYEFHSDANYQSEYYINFEYNSITFKNWLQLTLLTLI
jgi:hypothetical protein